MKLETKIGADGFLFNTQGLPQGTPSKEFYKDRRQALAAVAELFPEDTGTPCGCHHEKLLAKEYGADELGEVLRNQYQLSKLVQQCLCPLAKRRRTAVCAHAGKDLRPDPLGDVLLELDRLQLLDHASWNEWFKKTSDAINAIDTSVGENRRADNVDEIIASSMEKQSALDREIEERRRLLASFLIQAMEYAEME